MKQVLQSYRTGELWLADVPPPVGAPLGARVRTRSSLVSAGTERSMIQLAQKSLLGKARERPDLVRRVLQKVKDEGLWTTVEQVQQKLDVPVPLGYSAAGVIEDAVEAPGLLPGMRVAVAGAGLASHAEMNWVPRNLIAPLPDNVSFEQGACATLGAIALQGVRQAEPRLGDRIVVIGLGLIGNFAAQLARASGARVFAYDLAQDKVDIALATGCHAGTSDPDTVVEQVMAFTGGHGADAVIIAASAPGNSGPVALAVEMARLRGKLIALGNIGTELPRNEAYLKELDLRMSMSYGPGRYDAAYEERGEDYPYAYVRYTEQRNMVAFLEAIADGQVLTEPLLTHRFRIDDAMSAYELVQTGSEPHIGIILQYGTSDDPDLAKPSAPRPAAKPAGASAATVGGTSPEPGVGCLGAGAYMRSQILPKLKKDRGVRCVGVVNRTGASADLARATGGFAWGSTDAERLLSDATIDAVFIGTRHRLHAEQAIAALKAGKHVFVEKPAVLNDDELSELAAAQAEAGRYLQVGTNRRHSPYTQAVRDVFAGRTDPLTITYRINAGRIPAEHWLRDPVEGGGRLVGEGIHFIDWCQAVVGKPITRVFTMPAGAGPTASADDTFCITLGFADGSLASITYAADGGRNLPKEAIEVAGLGRTVTVDNWTRGTVHTNASSSPLKVGRGQLKGSSEQLDAFFRSIRTGVPAVALDTTWHVHHATLVAARSLRDGLPAEVSWPRPA